MKLHSEGCKCRWKVEMSTRVNKVDKGVLLTVSNPHYEAIGGIVSKETVCCVGGKVKH